MADAYFLKHRLGSEYCSFADYDIAAGVDFTIEVMWKNLQPQSSSTLLRILGRLQNTRSDLFISSTSLAMENLAGSNAAISFSTMSFNDNMSNGNVWTVLISRTSNVLSAVATDLTTNIVHNSNTDTQSGAFNFNQFFRQQTFGTLEFDFYQIKFDTARHYKKTTATGSTFPDILGAGSTDATLIGFPTDGSQWELYDDGTGSADTTITGAFSFAPFEFSGNASATLPQPISNSAFDLPEFTIAGAQSASLPQPITSGAFSFNALDFSGTQSSSLPQPITNASFELPEFSVSGDISASLPDNTVTSTGAFSFAPLEFSGAQSSTQPQPTSDAAFDLPILTLLATQSASLPQPTVSGAFTLPAFDIVGSMSLGIPQPIVNGSFELPGFTFSGSGSATFPQPTISGSFELPAITVLGSVSLSGVVINVENSGIIILQAGESSIKLDALSNQIFLH